MGLRLPSLVPHLLMGMHTLRYAQWYGPISRDIEPVKEFQWAELLGTRIPCVNGGER